MNELRAYNVTNIARVTMEETTRTVIAKSAVEAIEYAMCTYTEFDHVTLVEPVKGTESDKQCPDAEFSPDITGRSFDGEAMTGQHVDEETFYQPGFLG